MSRMLTIGSYVSGDCGERGWRATDADAPLRGVDPTAAAARQRYAPRTAPHLSARLVTPFVAQLIGQIDAVREPAAARDVAFAYQRVSEPAFLPIDLVPPA
jgi:hypothetical protein